MQLPEDLFRPDSQPFQAKPAGDDLYVLTGLGPIAHQVPPLVEQGAALVGRFGFVRNSVCQRMFDDLAREGSGPPPSR